MLESIQSTLASALLRTLQLNPSLTVSEGIDHVDSMLSAVPLFPADHIWVRQFLKGYAILSRRRGVLNPVWLSQARGIELYYNFVRAQPGWAKFLEEQQSASAQITCYLLYGDLDVLFSLHGVPAEAGTLLDRIMTTAPYDCVSFSVAKVLLFHRCRTRKPDLSGFSDAENPTLPAAADLINRLVDDYDDPSVKEQALRLTNAGVLLGPMWDFDDLPITDISAYVGITARGPVHTLESGPLLDELLEDDMIRGCLVHFLELERGSPFNNLIKLTCSDRDELDRVTRALNARRVGRVTLDTTTFVIVRGTERMPLVSGQQSPDVVRPDTRGIESLAQATLEHYGPKAIASFNALEPRLQPVVLDCLHGLQDKLKAEQWEDEIEADLTTAFQLFSQAALDGGLPGTLHGPVINLAMVVEGAFKTGLERIIRRVYGNDLGRAQNELKLRSRKFSELALGNIGSGLRSIKASEAYAYIAPALDDEYIDRLERFAHDRNQWAHAGRKRPSPYDEIDQARRIFGEGIDLLRWLDGWLLPALDGPAVPPGQEPAVQELTPADREQPPAGRRHGVFISYSSADTDTANRIAVSLNALNYPVWYADSSIMAGESIADRVGEALTRSDTLVILLSNSSISSRWVRRELNVALMDQLAGQDVVLVPVVIEPCPVPAVLRNVRAIDMRPERFQQGFIELIEFLSNRQLLRAPASD